MRHFVCDRHCSRATTFVIAQKNPDDSRTLEENPPETIDRNINAFFDLEGYISLKDEGTTEPPDHVPPDLAKIFEEATKCVAVQCWNAAGAMFRLYLDMATEPLLPEGEVAGPKFSYTKKSWATRGLAI